MRELKISEVTRNLFGALISHPWLYFPFHGPTLGDGNDTATQAHDRANAQTNGQTTELFTDGLLTVEGTTAGIWTDNEGWLTPSGDNYTQDSTLEVHDFFDMSTLTNGGLLFCFRLRVSSDLATGAEYFMSYSDLDTDEGGFAFNFNTAEKVFVGLRDTNNNSVNLCSDATAISVDTEYAYCVYLDCKNLEASLYRNGVEGSSKLNPIPAALPTLNQLAGFVIFGRSGGVASNKVGQNGSGGMLRDLIIIRAETDIAANIGAIAMDYYKNLGDIPKTLTEI